MKHLRIRTLIIVIIGLLWVLQDVSALASSDPLGPQARPELRLRVTCTGGPRFRS